MPSHLEEENCDDIPFPVPGNYETCLDVFRLWKKIIDVVGNIHLSLFVLSKLQGRLQLFLYVLFKEMHQEYMFQRLCF